MLNHEEIKKDLQRIIIIKPSPQWMPWFIHDGCQWTLAVSLFSTFQQGADYCCILAELTRVRLQK